MKRFLVVLIGALSLFVFHNTIYAHSRGFPILTINGVLTKVYPNESSSIKPYLGDSADIASENYLVNQNLECDFEASRSAQLGEIFGWKEEMLEKVTYTWDFGDGTEKKKTNTPKNSHIYKKMGSYIMEILADYSQAGGSNSYPQVVQTTLLHILPNKDYKLPEPIIKINGQIVPSSSLTLGNSPKESTSSSGLARLLGNKGTNLELDFNKRLSFDASGSKAPLSKIIQYQWDLGQGGDVVKSKTASIKYKLPQALITPVLRVTDENGFIAEAAVNLENSGKNEPSGFSLEELISPTTLLISAQAVVVAVGIIWYIRRKRKKI